MPSPSTKSLEIPPRKRMRVTVRKVSFAENPEIFFIDKLENEDQNDVDVAESENKTSERTSQLTVLSSLHGRARRELRDTTKLDVQSVIKNGVKTRGHRCPKTGLPRWKYEYGNVVVITDHTSTVEVTSYKKPVTIHPAPINAEMLARHNEDIQALRDDPQLCTTHSIIIIDQSGSMRASDVNCFRSRSDAAYGVLALEYIAEQLHTQDGNEGALDAVSVIEMNDGGSLIVDREPLDWILFNKLVERQSTAVPRSHGSYNNSLLLAKSMIEKEIRETEDADVEDMPSYALIFLSDGKPSDNTAYDAQHRFEILEDLSSLLGSKLTFFAMGIGASDSDFSALLAMASHVEAFGSQGTFEYAQLSAAKLSHAFSSIATSMTATRTEMLSVHSKESKKQKDISLRARHIPQDERRFKRHTQEVSRWRYDHKRFKQNLEPWCKAKFKNRGTAGFDMEDKPFGKGAERLAYMFFEIDANGKRLGKPMVAKESNRVDSEERKVKFHEGFCRTQRKAKEIANLFNKTVRKSRNLLPIETWVKLPQASFLDCYVYEYRATDGMICGLLVEQYLRGKFTKYNGNNGFVCQKHREIELEIGAVYLTDFLQAFSHWVYCETNQQLLLCDLQGVLNEEGRHPRFELTDPCICTKKGKRYGKTDLRAKGFKNFRRTHNCNLVCKGLGLPPFGRKR